MASIARLEYQLSVQDARGIEVTVPRNSVAWSITAALLNGQRESVSLNSAGFTALTPPTGAKAVAFILGTAKGLTLKGISGDTGVKLTPASSPLGIDAIFPLGTSPSIGIACSGTGPTIEILWF